VTFFFGERWDAPIVDDAIQIETPAGASCYDCAEAIAPGDRGFVRPLIRSETEAEIGYVHAECDLRSTCGCMVGLCRCHGYPTNRDTARLVWAHYYGDRAARLA
jgi:hypothetical protein